MAVKKVNSSGLAITINTDGVTVGGGSTTEASITSKGGDTTIDNTGNNTNEVTFPSAAKSVLTCNGQVLAFYTGMAMP